MVSPIRVYGEFNLSSSLARRVHRAVEEFTSESLRLDLSHVGDDCALCQATGDVETLNDASQSNRASRQWNA